MSWRARLRSTHRTSAELALIRLHVAFSALAKTSDHQRGGKGPRLRRVISLPRPLSRRFLHQLAPHGFLAGFRRARRARSAEKYRRETACRVRPGMPPRELASMMTDRVNSGKMLGLAFAYPAISRVHNFRSGSPTTSDKSVALDANRFIALASR